VVRIGWRRELAARDTGGMNRGGCNASSLRAAELIENDPAAPHTLSSLSKATGMSVTHLRRCFLRDLGMSPAEYLRAVRLGKMREGLKAGARVSSAGYEAGFGSDRAIWEHASRGLGMPADAYRHGGKGVEIRFTTAATTVGEIAVGTTIRGVCCVLFVEARVAADAIRAEFPAASVERDDAAVRPQAERIARMIETGEADGDIPLDLIGTPFQRRVWAELRAIPTGSTRTYSDVARAIGKPGATRAVAGACARNHAAVVVPCHRVVRTDGGLGGYRWGVERKRGLLAAESGSDTQE
jgi:AraC family transcriptional regulator of adaptative response/methylated-DNA-[protein]-cysteine methyltransferase